jgi:hypothetical protein
LKLTGQLRLAARGELIPETKHVLLIDLTKSRSKRLNVDGCHGPYTNQTTMAKPKKITAMNVVTQTAVCHA